MLKVNLLEFLYFWSHFFYSSERFKNFTVYCNFFKIELKEIKKIKFYDKLSGYGFIEKKRIDRIGETLQKKNRKKFSN